MLQIERVLATPAMGGYYFDDLAAIRAGARQDGFFYIGDPITPGHTRIRQPGEAISFILVLSDGQIACGDAVAIQYSGVVGRDPVLNAAEYLPDVERIIAPAFEGIPVTNFRELTSRLDTLRKSGQALHTGLRYGMSQALLDAVARGSRCTMAEVVANEWGLDWSPDPVPVLAQSGDDRLIGADKMILKQVEALPQGLFNSTAKIGDDGQLLVDYVRWLSRRIRELGPSGYSPTIHLDVYGTVGSIFQNDIPRTARYLHDLEVVAQPYPVRVEAPVDAEACDAVIELMANLRAELASIGSEMQIVADDWCNTLQDIQAFLDAGAAHMVQVKTPDLGSLSESVEAVLACHRSGTQAFLGGTCNGTDVSSKATVHVAMATRADLIYNKPGMGVDEGLMIVRNEMARVRVLVENRPRPAGPVTRAGPQDLAAIRG